jgi:membrane associated rhomboid family serine protease
MAKCEQCGSEFSNWFGEQKRLCPNCERNAPPTTKPEILPPETGDQAAQPRLALPPPTVTRILIGINVAVFVAMALATKQIVDFNIATVLHWGADFGPATAGGEWWRMLTAMFLHGGIIHIAVNMWALRNLGYTAELFYGRRNYLIIYMLSGLGGSAGTLVWHPDVVGVGASGAIFGVAGALAALVYFKKLPVDRAALKRSVGSIGAVILYNLVIGAAVPIIDNSAHVGGLIAGTILGFALPATLFRVEREKTTSSGNLAIAGVVVVMLLIGFSAQRKLAADIEIYRAENAYDAGRKDEAGQHIQRAAALHPTSFYANYVIAAYYLDNGQNTAALPYAESAVRIQPHNAGAQRLLTEARQPATRQQKSLPTPP